MKANEFIKRHGINRAKEVIADTPKRAEYYRDMDSVCDPNEVLYYVWFGCKLLVFNGDKWELSIMCPLCGRQKGGVVCGYCGWYPGSKVILHVGRRLHE